MPVLDPIHSLIVAILVAFVFAHAATHKVLDYTRHVGIVANYRVMPAWFVPLLAPLPLANRSLHLADWILVALASSAVIAVYYIGDLLIANWLKLGKLKSV